MVLLVNNLGGTSNLEMAVVTRAAVAALRARGLLVQRVYSGAVMTSIAMAGFSLTLFVPSQPTAMLALLDAPTTAPAWPGPQPGLAPPTDLTLPPAVAPATAAQLGPARPDLSAPVARALVAAMNALVAATASLNSLDAACGDGDCGTAHQQAATAVLAALGVGPSQVPSYLVLSPPSRLLGGLAELVATAAGGTSGAIYAILLSSAAQGLAEDAGPREWVAAARAGAEAVQRYGGAAAGDRTMLDALLPALDVCQDISDGRDWKEVLPRAAAAATEGAAQTATLRAQAGRASYVDPARVTTPDAGATALATVLQALAAVLCAT